MKRLLYRLLLIASHSSLTAQFSVDPISLIHPLRFDLMAKYIYAKHRELQVDSSFAKDLYAAHLLAMNDKFYEEVPSKNSLEDYLNNFHIILDTIKAYGYQANKCKQVPIWVKVSNQNPGSLYYCDGSHRISACLLNNQNVNIDYVEQNNFLPPYNYKFLRRKKLAEKYLDAMALEYCKLSKKCFLAFIFPCFSGNMQNVYTILGGEEKIAYSKEIHFPSMHSQMNLLDQLYSGWNSYTPGAMRDWQGYFPNTSNNKVTIFLFESDSLDSVREVKNKVRQLGGSHFVIHTTDEPEETLEVAKLIFVENSLHFINQRKLGKQVNLEQFLTKYQTWLSQNNVDQDCFCVDGSAIMAAYGLRDCRDLDFLHHGYDNLLTQLKTEEISSHNCEMQYHNKPKDEIIFNPDNFFYYKGIKFGALQIVQTMKQLRHEIPKDIDDLKLINSLL